MPHSAHWLTLTYALSSRCVPPCGLPPQLRPCQFNPFGPPLLSSPLGSTLVTPELRGTQWLGLLPLNPLTLSIGCFPSSPLHSGVRGKCSYFSGYDSPLPQLGVPRA